MTSLNIRRYEAGDYLAVWQLHQLGLRLMGADLGEGPWHEDLHQIEKVYLNGQGDFLVGQVDSRLVAMGALKRTDPLRAEIKRMRIHPDYWRRGFGQAVLSALEQRASLLGYQKIHLDTSSYQEPASQLYQKNGYQAVRRRIIRNLEIIFYEKEL